MGEDCSTAEFPFDDQTYAEKAPHLAACSATATRTVAAMAQRMIWLHSDAPPKPAYGAPCNGCGTCCAAEPCPVGMLLSLRMRGRCRLLRYDTAGSSYRCGLLPDAGVADGAPRAFSDRPPGLRQRLVARWIGAGLGCDSSAEATAARR